VNLLDQLDKATAPPAKASAVRRLSLEEIERLQGEGQITPPERIPQSHLCGRESVPVRWGRGRYCYQGFRGRS
jgi:hypothetical protein